MGVHEPVLVKIIGTQFVQRWGYLHETLQGIHVNFCIIVIMSCNLSIDIYW